MPRLEGHVSYAGSPQPGAHVLLADPAGQRLLAQASSSEAGRFALEAGELPSGALVLAKCSNDAVGLAVAEAGAGTELTLGLEARGPFWPLTVEVAGDDLPEELELMLVPRALEAVPDEWLWLLSLPVDGVVYGGFAVRPLRGGSLTLPVQAGRWLISAQRLVAFAAYSPDVEPPRSWQTVAAEVGGRPLAGDPQGFEVELRGPTTVRLRVEAQAGG